MRKRVVKDILVYTAITIILMVIGLFVYGNKVNNQQVDYSSYSSEENGVKALYLVVEQMGFEAGRYKKNSRLLPDNVTMVCINPDLLFFNDKYERKYLKAWIERGNTFILAGDESRINEYRLEELSADYYDRQGYLGGTVLNIGNGRLIFLNNCDDYTNEGLKLVTPGIEFIKLLVNEKNNRILFNEYYHGIHEGSGFWDITGPMVKIIILQSIIGLIVLMFISSRRFGKPMPVYQIVKRKENENLSALSNIFIKSRANKLVLEMHLNDLKSQLSRYLGFSYVASDKEIIEAVSSNKYLMSMKLDEILPLCNLYMEDNKKDTRKLLKLVSRMDEIRKGIR